MALHCPVPMSPVAGFFNGLSPAKLGTLGDIYSPGVEFRNPIYQTRGLGEIRRVYEHLFKRLQQVALTVSDAHGDEHSGFLRWTLSYQVRGKERVLTGTSHIEFARDGRVAVQHDHWDASFAVYGEFPLLGPVLRAIQRRLKLPA